MTSISNPSTIDQWRSLFKEGGTPCKVLVLRKQGHPLMVLAGKARFSPQSATLYPAQGFKARLLRHLLVLALRLRILPLLRHEKLCFDQTDPLAKKIFDPISQSADFAILCGNPRMKGQRFMILAGKSGQRIVIKAGNSKTAQFLIVNETRMLERIQGSPHTPTLVESFQNNEFAAFATPFIEGDSPSPDSMDKVADVLESWIEEGDIPFGDIPAWQRLIAAASYPGLNFKGAESRRIAKILSHGDFAPWNIKVIADNWMVLDWERGEIPGIPGWDWFHFLIQTQILVLCASPGQVLQRLQELIATPRFQAYAQKTGIQGIEWQLLAAYLEEKVIVNQPSDGLKCLEKLRLLVAEKMSNLNNPASLSLPV